MKISPFITAKSSMVYPCAKINLGLYITERLPNGYHNLETVFYPIPVFDKLSIEVDESLQSDYIFTQNGNMLDCQLDDNLVVKALKNLKADFNIPKIRIELEKNIPSGAGLGGGSSDAAFTMKTLNEMFTLGLSKEEMEQRVSSLGADCAFFIRCAPVAARGIGDVFSPIDVSLKGLYMVLVKPDVFVSTKDAYAGVIPYKTTSTIEEKIETGVDSWKGRLINDFENTVFPKFPEIETVKQRLYDAGAVYASMSGSGSSVYGIFKNKPADTLRSSFTSCFYSDFKL